MIASIGNTSPASSLARPGTSRSTGTIFGSSSPQALATVAKAASAPAVRGEASIRDGNPPDFTSITRQQVRDWTNDLVKSGKLSFDDGSALALSSGKVSFDGTSATDDAYKTEKVDFVGLLQNGIAGARTRGDQNAVSRLQTALTIMNGNQESVSTDYASTAESSVKFKAPVESFRKEAVPTPVSTTG